LRSSTSHAALWWNGAITDEGSTGLGFPDVARDLEAGWRVPGSAPKYSSKDRFSCISTTMCCRSRKGEGCRPPLCRTSATALGAHAAAATAAAQTTTASLLVPLIPLLQRAGSAQRRGPTRDRRQHSPPRPTWPLSVTVTLVDDGLCWLRSRRNHLWNSRS